MPYFIMKSRKLSLRSVIEQDARYRHTVLQVLANVGRIEKLKSIINHRLPFLPTSDTHMQS